MPNERSEQVTVKGKAKACPDCGGTGGYVPAYVSFGEIIGQEACATCSGTGEVANLEHADQPTDALCDDLRRVEEEADRPAATNPVTLTDQAAIDEAKESWAEREGGKELPDSDGFWMRFGQPWIIRLKQDGWVDFCGMNEDHEDSCCGTCHMSGLLTEGWIKVAPAAPCGECERLRAYHELAERYRPQIAEAAGMSGDPHWGDIATVLGAKIAKLIREAEKWRDEANELEDCRESLRRLGHVCGCDHVESADERAVQEQHIEEAFAEKVRESAEQAATITRLTEQVKAMRAALREIAVTESDDYSDGAARAKMGALAAAALRSLPREVPPAEQWLRQLPAAKAGQCVMEAAKEEIERLRGQLSAIDDAIGDAAKQLGFPLSKANYEELRGAACLDGLILELAGKVRERLAEVERDRDRYERRFGDCMDKLGEWQKATGCSHPEAAREAIATARREAREAKGVLSRISQEATRRYNAGDTSFPGIVLDIIGGSDAEARYAATPTPGENQ